MAALRDFNILLRTVVLAGLVVLGGWWTLLLRSKLTESRVELESRVAEIASLQQDLQEREGQIRELGELLTERTAEIARLQVELAEKEKRIETLELARKLLATDHRVARIEILAQGSSADDPERVRTTLRFTELDAEGESLAPGRELTLEGRTIYVESLVIKFEDSYVEQGDPLRGTSLCLFRRLFGEDQSPAEGVALDATGEQPLAYGDDRDLPPLHRAIWERFWDYANEPELAATLGIKALHGEAPFIEARPGRSYRVELRTSGGLTIEAE